ncbi:MAG: MFS transporter [Planctomycetes bacterium]|nr:MFS transporter [Planctomycetota bacterium]
MKKRLNIAGFSWAVSFGALATLASLSMEKADLSRLEIGLHGSAYYFSIALGSVFMTRLIRSMGNITIILGLMGASLSVVLFSFVNSSSEWLVLRMINGFSAAMALVPLETLVYQNAGPFEKAKVFGLFELCLSAGVGIGASLAPLLESIHIKTGYILFGLFPLLGVIALFAIKIKIENAAELEVVSFGDIKKMFVWFCTAFTQGFLEGGLLSYLGLIILGMGYAADDVSIVFGSMFAGVLCSMLFITRLADAIGHKRVLLLTHVLSLVCLILMGFTKSIVVIAIFIFFVGLTCGGQYAVALASLGLQIENKKQPSANSVYLTLNCAGSVAGPIVMGLLGREGIVGSIFLIGSVPILILLLVWLVNICCYKNKVEF